LVDTNVLIAASTYMFSRDLSIELKHKFFDQTMSLIGLLKKHLAKRIGITTPTIEDEAYYNLEEAVREEVDKITDRKVDFVLFSTILNSCENRLKEVLSYLLREPVDQHQVNQNYLKVANMYEALTRKARSLPTPKKYATIRKKSVSPGLRTAAFDAFLITHKNRNAQLFHLLSKPVEESDKIILAEAIYLFNLYKQTYGKGVTFLISSMDHHFSPIRKSGFESRPVTDTILDNFGIMCDWPYQVEQTLKSYLK